MSNFCLYFCIKEHIDKIKIDYYIIPVKKNDNLFTSVVSEETFDLKDFKEELEQNWTKGLEEIDEENNKLRKDSEEQRKWYKWLSRK